MAPRRSPVGAHVSAAGGLLQALPRAEAVGAGAMQLFGSSPRAWVAPPDDPEGDAAFAAAKRATAQFFATRLLSQVPSLLANVRESAAEAMAADVAAF